MVLIWRRFFNSTPLNSILLGNIATNNSIHRQKVHTNQTCMPGTLKEFLFTTARTQTTTQTLSTTQTSL